jgi:hypothetical protein
MFSGANPPVAARSSASENSASAGTSRPPPARAADGGGAWCWLSETDGRCDAAPTARPGGFFSGCVPARSEEPQQPMRRGVHLLTPWPVCGVGWVRRLCFGEEPSRKGGGRREQVALGLVAFAAAVSCLCKGFRPFFAAAVSRRACGAVVQS